MVTPSDKNLPEKLRGAELVEELPLLWNSKVQYRVHRILSLDPILSQLNPVTFTQTLISLGSILILFSHALSSLQILLLKFEMHFSSSQGVLDVGPYHLLNLIILTINSETQ